MRLVLYSLCIFIVLLASALFILGYEGTQIREFLIGVAAIIVLASRMIKTQQDINEPQVKSEQAETRRKRRLSARNEIPEDESKSSDDSEATYNG
ncbi:MAG: hypothetical protein OXI77_03655 [Chloroflexota bacterium]|nr:hypothetical protein [Chloroflexota bacterium]MDE2908384.1 hypothetical protein [Chloroflexota bacterium]